MTESEAIETLIGIRRVSGYSKRREEALDMAIAALEKQEGEGGLTMAEYISRDWLLTHTHTGMDTIQMMQTMIDAPAADVVEVRHGRWIKIDGLSSDYYCSECNKKWWTPFPEEMHYCPNCGAKMEV